MKKHFKTLRISLFAAGYTAKCENSEMETFMSSDPLLLSNLKNLYALLYKII